MLTRLAIVAALVGLAGPATATAEAPSPDRGPSPQPALPSPAPQVPEPPKADQYVVQLDAAPVGRYQGGTKGLEATAPSTTGRAIDPTSAATRAYATELQDRQDQALRAAAPATKPSTEYRFAFAGFAAELSDEQARALRAQPGIKAVTKEQFLHTRSVAAGGAGTAGAAAAGLRGTEAQLMGLPNGLWRQLGGPAQAGRGVVIGIVDSGITPESSSFRDPGLAPPQGWAGTCESGDRFPATTCNNKLVGARYFADGIGRDQLPPNVYLSPRDENGHGTHVAATAAGVSGVDPFIGANLLGVDRLTGVAPAAHLAVYKACWMSGFCSDVDVVAAIDAAVRDGVDVINLSLSGVDDPEGGPSPLGQATLGADAAGVFVAAAAGNAGTYPGALGPPASAPWTTAVAATTGTRAFRSTIQVSAGTKRAKIEASTTWAGFPTTTPLLDARSLAPDYEGPIYADPRFCFDGMTREQVAGKIVLCDEFTPAGVISSRLRPLGAKGFIIAAGSDDLDDPILRTDPPNAVIGARQLAAVRKAIASGGTASVTATATPGTATPIAPDQMGGFSSRGPALGREDLLRPDVAAPGVSVLAAFAPPFGTTTPAFAVLNGTSMAAPQVAGAAALLVQAHPTWSPAQLRSALVTTAKPVTDHGQVASPVASGGGRIDPTAAANPGLVVAPSTGEYQAFAAGTLAAPDLNMPSVQFGQILRSTSVTRTVTSVSSARSRWRATVEGGPAGPSGGQVVPSRFAIAPGQSRPLQINLRNPQGRVGFQRLTVVLRELNGARTVRIPVSLRNPGIVDPPETIVVDEASPDESQAVEAVTSGRVHGVGHGLVAPTVRPGLLTSSPAGNPYRQDLTIPFSLDRPTPLLAVEASPQDGGPAPWVRIYRDVDEDGRFSPVDYVGQMSREPRPGDDTSTAWASRLPAGKYLVWVVTDDRTAPMPFDLRTWNVADPGSNQPPAAKLVVDDGPETAPGETRTFGVRWNGALGEEPLLGLIEWRGDGRDNVLASSIVRVTPRDPTPEAEDGPEATGSED